jgi:hypothetical protein
VTGNLWLQQNLKCVPRSVCCAGMHIAISSLNCWCLHSHQGGLLLRDCGSRFVTYLSRPLAVRPSPGPTCQSSCGLSRSKSDVTETARDSKNIQVTNLELQSRFLIPYISRMSLRKGKTAIRRFGDRLYVGCTPLTYKRLYFVYFNYIDVHSRKRQNMKMLKAVQLLATRAIRGEYI